MGNAPLRESPFRPHSGVMSRVATPRPQPPFDSWPVQFFDPRYGFAWYIEPAILVTQSVEKHGSLAVINLFNDVVDEILELRAESIRAARGLFFFYDWRSVESYDSDARIRQTERMRRRPSGYNRRTVIVVSPQNRFLSMALEAANLFSTIALKSRIELATNAAEALAHADIHRPAAETPFPSRRPLRP
jgi:hypothetical protein